MLRIIRLNERLINEEERIRVVAEALHKALEKQKAEKVFDDYNISASLMLFSNEEECNKRHGVEVGDPFFVDKHYTMFSAGMDESFYTDDWNEWSDKFSINDRMCYTMHHIYEHQKVTIEDLVATDEVWIELNVDYQFISKEPSPSGFQPGRIVWKNMLSLIVLLGIIAYL